MKKVFFLAMLTILPTFTSADWQPDRISLAYGQLISPFANRHAEIDQYRQGLAWNLSDDLWSSDTLLLQSYAELALSNWKSTLNPVKTAVKQGQIV